MKTPNQNATDALEQLSAQFFYSDIGEGKLLRISLESRGGVLGDPNITLDVINASSQRVASHGFIELKLSQTYGAGVRLLETPMCDPETGAQGFAMVLRSPVYLVRKTGGPII